MRRQDSASLEPRRADILTRCGQAPSEDETCPLRQLQVTASHLSVTTAQEACLVSGSDSCDHRHKLPFEYPIIFWTTSEV